MVDLAGTTYQDLDQSLVTGSITLPPFGSRILVGPGAPTAIELTDLRAAGGADSVTVAWSTAQEVDHAGYHVERAPASSGPWVRRTPAPIPGRGGPTHGADYEWTDAPLDAGRYWYRLIDLDLAGVETVHGPIDARVGAGCGSMESAGGAGPWVIVALVIGLVPGRPRGAGDRRRSGVG